MAWEHCDATLLDTEATCPTCGLTKEQWTVEIQVTREFTVQRTPSFRAEVLSEDEDPVAELAYRIDVEGDDEPIEGELSDLGTFRERRQAKGAGVLVFPGLSAECLTLARRETEESEASAEGEGEPDSASSDASSDDDSNDASSDGGSSETFEEASFEIETGKKLALRLKIRLDLELRFHGAKLCNTDYTLELPDGTRLEGTSDDNARLSQELPGAPRQVVLHLQDPECSVPIRVEPLAPPDEVAGAQQRLNDLGYACGPADGESGPRTQAALERFQRDHELDVSGELDSQTVDSLVSEFGY